MLDEPVPLTRTYTYWTNLSHLLELIHIGPTCPKYYEESSRCSEEKMERLLRLDYRLRSTTYTGWLINKKIEESYQRTIPTVS